MKTRITLFLLTAIIFWYSTYAGSPFPVSSKISSDTLPQIIIVSSFDPMSIEARKNKRELFKELTDSLESYLARKMKGQTGQEVIVIPGIIRGNIDTIVYTLLKENNAVKAILIRSLDVFFDEVGESNTYDSDGKPQITTKYDLCSRVEYVIYKRGERSNESAISNREYFTSRSVKEKRFVIKFGPDIVGKKKHTYGIVEKNAEEFIIRNGDLLGN